MKHTFVIMAYKDSIFLEDCLKSIKNQTIKSDVCISTSTPSDYLYNIARKNNIKIYITDSKKGIGHDWNFSIQQANTKYLTLAHQDDLYESEYVQKCLEVAELYDDTLICFTDYSELKNGKIIKNNFLLKIKRIILLFFMPFKKNISNSHIKNALLSLGNPIACPSVMFNMHNLKEVRFNEKYKTCLDWDAWYNFAKKRGRFVYIPISLLVHRIHEDSATTESIKEKLRQQEDLEMFSNFWPKPLALFFSYIYSLSYTSNKL